MPATTSTSKPGKRFEQDFEKSCERDGVYAYRLKDCGGWASASELRFTPSNDYDFFLYRLPTALAVEQKSVAGKSLRYDALRDKQWKGLLRAAQRGLVAGVLVEFRGAGEVWFVRIEQLVAMRQQSAKASFNVKELHGIGVFVNRGLAVTRYQYDVGELIDNVKGKR